MNIEITNYTRIEKEELVNFKITKLDVLSGDEVRQRLRNIYLTKAELLGNVYKGKVKMYIGLEDGNYVAVETTIWHVNDGFVSLKAGVSVPVKAIIGIEF
jgi:hypothetical protein